MACSPSAAVTPTRPCEPPAQESVAPLVTSDRAATTCFSIAVQIIQLGVSVPGYARIGAGSCRLALKQGRGDMVRFTAAAIALAWTASAAGEGHAAPASGARQPPPTGAALITHCFKLAHGIVPRRIRDRSAWVVRHADHCVRGGGSL